MRLVIFFSVLLLVIPCFAKHDFFLGVENSRFAYAGVSFEHIGIRYKQSVFIQDFDLQCWEAGFFFRTTLQNTILMVSPYYGARYNQDFYRFGNLFTIETRYNFPVNYFIEMMLDYDSIYKYNTFYSSRISLAFYSHLHLIAGVKNAPEFRRKETRLVGGILLQDEHSSIMPYISRPYDDALSTVRFNLDFLWNL